MAVWWTPDGKRILTGAEGRLFRKALAVLVDVLHEEHREGGPALWQCGIPIFDKLEPGQRLGLLAEDLTTDG